MSGDIFLQRGPDDLVSMREAPYNSEEVLQKLLAKFPHLLAGDQLAGDEPRQWVLVEREASVPDDEDAAGRWSLDHLFLDQDAVPTLVEVKRSSDSRIRREVVGQLIDYAANGVVYWPTEKLRASFESRLQREGLDNRSKRNVHDRVFRDRDSRDLVQPTRVFRAYVRRPCRQHGGPRFLQGGARLVLRDGAFGRAGSRRGLTRR